MLVEDDKSLREIYGVRLLAEGYDIVSAEDGETALAMAIKERPKLIVSDVMMPKISGFEMLDILRSTTETRDIKVIMMTALSSEDQRNRGNQLGADRYLVKSQVGIEDVVRVVHEVLGDAPARPAPQPAPSQISTPAQNLNPPAVAARPTAPAMARPAAPQQPPAIPANQNPAAPSPRPQVYVQPTAATPPPASPQPGSTTLSPAPPSTRNRVIQPISDPHSARVDINELLDRELAKEAGIDFNQRPTVSTTAQEKTIVSDQLGQFAAPIPPGQPPAPQPPTASVPTIQIDTQGRVSMPTDSAAVPPPPVPPQPSAPPTPPPRVP